MTQSPSISIIVPVYKAEPYIHRCLDSIVAQTFKDWECILVDDGSPDRSGRICDEYAARDPRFRVIHQANGGVSRARQAGTDAACGEYTIHCDPDDWVEPAMLASLYAKAKADDADMVICDFYIEQNGITTRCHQEPQSYAPCDVIRQMLTPPQAPLQQLHGSCCNKLVRQACYNNPHVHFPEGVNLCEDLYVNCNLLYYSAAKVTYLNKAFYHYQIIEGASSVSQSYSAKTITELQRFVSLMSQTKFTDIPEELYCSKIFILVKFVQAHRFSEIKLTYPEIHQTIIDQHFKFYIFSPYSYILQQVLKGHTIKAHFLYYLSKYALQFKNRVRGL